MESIINAILKLIGLSGRAYKEGKPKMGSDFLDAALHIAEQNQVNLNKIIYETQRSQKDLDSNRKDVVDSEHHS